MGGLQHKCDNMKLVYINYSDVNYRDHQIELMEYVNSIKLFDEGVSYTQEWLATTDFYQNNIHILKKHRLAGYAIWKPYIILETFNHIEDGDVVVYMDCGDKPLSGITNHIRTYMQRCDQYLVPQYYNGVHKLFTKRDCFYYMQCDNELYWNSIQLENGFMAFKKTRFNEKLMQEYLAYCCDERIVTDIPNQCGLPNFDGFIDHRHDQSIITNLQIKYNLATSSDVRPYIQWNILHHKDGEEYSNGTYHWPSSGMINA